MPTPGHVSPVVHICHSSAGAEQPTLILRDTIPTTNPTPAVANVGASVRVFAAGSTPHRNPETTMELTPQRWPNSIWAEVDVKPNLPGNDCHGGTLPPCHRL